MSPSSHDPSSTLWGIDLGGTKIEGVILDPADAHRQLLRLRIDTEADRGYEHIVGRIAGLVASMAERAGGRPAALGIATPGVLDPKLGKLKNSNTTCLIGHPLQRDLAAALGVRVAMANDANCFALAESTLGAARGLRVVFGIILGTGVGGGIVVNGEALSGLHGIAGEWGHNVLEENGAPCYCGKRGCVETVLAGPALERYYASLSGTRLGLREIARRAAASEDPDAAATIRRLVECFGKGVSWIINVLDPDAIVIGGGVGNIDILYTEAVRAEIRKHLFNNTFETRILKPALGDSAGCLGAAMLVARE